MGRIIFVGFLFICLMVVLFFIWKFLERVFHKFSRNKKFNDREVIFYKGEDWIVLGLFSNDFDNCSYSIMNMKTEEIVSVPEDDLLKLAIKQQDHLEAKLKSEAFVELYEGNDDLEKKYGKKSKK